MFNTHKPEQEPRKKMWRQRKIALNHNTLETNQRRAKREKKKKKKITTKGRIQIIVLDRIVYNTLLPH
jgi:hypothetical protein